MKRSYALVFAGLSVIIIYNILFSYGLIPLYPPLALSIGRAVVLILSFLLLACGLSSYLPLSNRIIPIKRKRMFRERDSTRYRRVVKDGVDGCDYLVYGSEHSTFRDACIVSWEFESIDRSSTWLVKDDRGNDITNNLLSSFDGIAVLIGDYGTESQRDATDADAEYSDLRDSVEYFDD